MPTISDESTSCTAARHIVRRVLTGGSPTGREFDACRALLRAESESESAFTALTILLEGCLADPRLPIDDTRVVVWLLKRLARHELVPGDLL